MKSLQDSITNSLDGKDPEIFPYLPYLLQDLVEIGSSPQSIAELIVRNNISKPRKVLDLGCGKGAVSVYLADKLGFQVTGIDGVPEFINEAKNWAKTNNAARLCKFIVSDIRETIKNYTDFDISILGSIGPVLGNITDTLNRVKNTTNDDGFIILDDGYIPSKSKFKNDNYLTEDDFFTSIDNADFEVIDRTTYDNDFMEESDTDIYEKIEKRAAELTLEEPGKRDLFDQYLDEQRKENYILENEVICTTLLLKRQD